MTSLDTDLARRFAETTQRKREAEEALREINKELAAIEKPLRHEMQLAGVASLPIETPSGRMTVYTHSTLWAKPKKDVDRQSVCDALEATGLDDLVSRNFNTHSVSAYVRETLAEGTPLDDRLSDVLDVLEVTNVRAVRSSGGKSAAQETMRETLKTMNEKR